ncbi:hypothetical protein DY000_02062708 [Brassica cretica]|uniref:Uncharacterized protein n=1 Tax=Brassica cretica TaxID=69181 RepID=A0ABQ7B3N0_BRACR|nr:hypothetical protein DY000_02062708 [Brassica cretica]
MALFAAGLLRFLGKVCESRKRKDSVFWDVNIESTFFRYAYRRRSFFALVSRPLCCPQGGPRRFFSSGCATGLLFWQCQLAFPVSACGVKHLFLARGVVYALALAYFECFSVLFPSRPLVLLVVSPSLDSAIFVSRVHDSADRFEPIGVRMYPFYSVSCLYIVLYIHLID